MQNTHKLKPSQHCHPKELLIMSAIHNRARNNSDNHFLALSLHARKQTTASIYSELLAARLPVNVISHSALNLTVFWHKTGVTLPKNRITEIAFTPWFTASSNQSSRRVARAVTSTSPSCFNQQNVTERLSATFKANYQPSAVPPSPTSRRSPITIVISYITGASLHAVIT